MYELASSKIAKTILANDRLENKKTWITREVGKDRFIMCKFNLADRKLETISIFKNKSIRNVFDVYDISDQENLETCLVIIVNEAIDEFRENKLAREAGYH